MSKERIFWSSMVLCCLLSIALSYDLHAQSISNLPNSPAPRGARELICPHGSARELNAFWRQNSAVSSSAAAALYAGSSQKSWAYLRLGSAWIPTLKEDGNTLDYQNKNMTYFVAYVPPKGDVKKAFWSHRFNNGESISAADRLLAEGVDDLADIQERARDADWAVVHAADLRSGQDVKDVIWTNTIFVRDSRAPSASNLREFRQVNEQLLNSLPRRDIQRLRGSDSTYVTVAKLQSGEIAVTVFGASDAPKFGHLVGELYAFREDDSAALASLMTSLQKQKRGRVYVFGELPRPLQTLQSQLRSQVEVIRRGPSINKSLADTDRQLVAIAGKGREAEKPLVLNGIPATEEDLVSMGKPTSGLANWENFRSDVAKTLAPHVSSTIETRAQLINELTQGKSDVLFLLAHFDGKSLFFGKERVALTELASLQDRQDAPPRTAIVVACNAGELSREARSMFRRSRDSLGELLIRKGFFSKVVGPEREIGHKDSMDALRSYLETSKISLSGWSTLADASVPGLDR